MEQVDAREYRSGVRAFLNILAVHDLISLALYAVTAEHDALVGEQVVVDLKDAVELLIINLRGEVGFAPCIVPHPVVGVAVNAGHQIEALDNIGVVRAVDLFPVLNHAVPRTCIAGSQHRGALAVEELVVCLIVGRKRDISLDGAFLIHVAQQLPRRDRVVAQVLAREIGGRCCRRRLPQACCR